MLICDENIAATTKPIDHRELRAFIMISLQLGWVNSTFLSMLNLVCKCVVGNSEVTALAP